MKMLLIKFSHYIRNIDFFSAIILFIKVEILRVQRLVFKGQTYFLRKGTSDHIVFFQVMVYGSYQYARSWKNVDVVIDAGANIGCTANYFTSLFPKARIISIEPEAKNFEQLVKNTAQLKNVTPLQKALWKNDGILDVDVNSNESWSFKVKESSIGIKDHSLIVEAISIDALIKQFNINVIDILKVDIEGAEYELFSENYEFWLPRVKYIMIELHDGYRSGCSTNVMKALARFNFSIRLTRKENIVFINSDLC